jgi:single-stranded-DNA-specific exonuclease
MGEGQRHLSLTLEQGGTRLRAVAFGRGDWADELEQHGGPITVCFQPVINRFQGRANAEVQLIDWQPAGQPIAHSPQGSADRAAGTTSALQ